MLITVTNFQVNGKLKKTFEDKLSDIDGTYSELFRECMRDIIKMTPEKIEDMVFRGRQNDLNEKLDDLKAQKEAKKAVTA